jgi:DNA (cytosine-5)-methyltransferase 1
MTAYYNEIDPAAAHVLRHLIDIGVIAPGVVDTRSIADIQPEDLDGFTQVHLFAGGGLWSSCRSACWMARLAPPLERLLPVPTVLVGRRPSRH